MYMLGQHNTALHRRVKSLGTHSSADRSCIVLQECKDLTPFEFNDDSHSGLEVSWLHLK